MPYEEQRDKEKLRKLYMAYANITRDADKAFFLTVQTIQEAGWGMKESGKNNFSGIKLKDGEDLQEGSLVKTKENFKNFNELESWINAKPQRTFAGYTANNIQDFKQKFVADQKYDATDWFKNFDTVEDGLRGKAVTIEKQYNKSYNATTLQGYIKGLRIGQDNGYAQDTEYKQKLMDIASPKATLLKRILDDNLIETTKQNLKNTRMESFTARQNLIKLTNASPAQMQQYHKGVVDKENNRGIS